MKTVLTWVAAATVLTLVVWAWRTRLTATQKRKLKTTIGKLILRALEGLLSKIVASVLAMVLNEGQVTLGTREGKVCRERLLAKSY